LYPNLLLALTYAFAAAVQPGPFQAFIVSQALGKGWRGAWPAALAPLISDVPVIVIVLLALSRVSETMISGLRLGGGVLLLFLAWGSYRSWRDDREEATADAKPEGTTLLKAVFVNLLGPGPWLGWSLIMGPLLLDSWRRSRVEGVLLVLVFYVTMVASLIGIILLFSGARSLGPRVRRMSIGFSALALAGFGVAQVWIGVRALGG